MTDITIKQGARILSPSEYEALRAQMPRYYKIYVIAILTIAMLMMAGCTSTPAQVSPQITTVTPTVIVTPVVVATTPIVVTATPRDPNENSIVGKWVSLNQTLTINSDGIFRSTGHNVLNMHLLDAKKFTVDCSAGIWIDTIADEDMPTTISLDDGVWMSNPDGYALIYAYDNHRTSAGVTTTISSRVSLNGNGTLKEYTRNNGCMSIQYTKVQ